MIQAAKKRNLKTGSSLYVIGREPEKNRIVKSTRRRIRPGRVLLWGIGSYLLVLFLMGGYEIWELRQELKRVELDQNMLLQQQQELKKEIDSLYDPEVIEKLARENLGMVLKGEIMVIPAIPGRDLPKPIDAKNIEIGD
jgi:cell division protein FtsL